MDSFNGKPKPFYAPADGVSVGDFVGDTVGDAVGDSVGDSEGAMCGEHRRVKKGCILLKNRTTFPRKHPCYPLPGPGPLAYLLLEISSEIPLAIQSATRKVLDVDEGCGGWK
jgi:hypothetical protein